MRTNIKNSNIHRLTVSLYTKKVEGQPFKNTHTYNDVNSREDAIKLIWAMHGSPEDTNHTMSRKVVKAFYNGKQFTPFV
jgi:hypothetical protein